MIYHYMCIITFIFSEMYSSLFTELIEIYLYYTQCLLIYTTVSCRMDHMFCVNNLIQYNHTMMNICI